MSKEQIKQVRFVDYQDDIVGMMMQMLYLEPQVVQIPVNRYIELDEMGVLKPFLWFDGDAVKGVALLFVSPSLRNPSVIDAATDVLWVKPEHRGRSSEFVHAIKRQLRLLGVDYWTVSSRDSHPIIHFLEKNQFNSLERVYVCRLGEV